MFALITPKFTFNSELVYWISGLTGGFIVTMILIKKKKSLNPIRHHKSRIRHWNTWSHNDPLSVFTHDDRGGVSSMESHMSPHDCGQKKKQRCCEMEPSSCWGNWDRKWGSVWGHGVQTQQSEDFVFPTILYSPTRSCCHTCVHTHTRTHTWLHTRFKPTTPPGPSSPRGESVISTNLFQPPP